MNAIEILTERIETTRAAMYAAFADGRDEEVRGLYDEIKACEAAIDTLRSVGYAEHGDHAEAEPSSTNLTITLLGECPFLRYCNSALSAEEVAKDYASWATRRKIKDDIAELRDCSLRMTRRTSR